MKNLLGKLTTNTISIRFKSGDKIDNVVIQGIVGNTMVVSYEGKTAVIEIPHIGYISIDGETIEVMRSILNEEESTQEENENTNQNTNKNNSQKNNNEKSNKKNNEENSSDTRSSSEEISSELGY